MNWKDRVFAIRMFVENPHTFWLSIIIWFMLVVVVASAIIRVRIKRENCAQLLSQARNISDSIVIVSNLKCSLDRK